MRLCFAALLLVSTACSTGTSNSPTSDAPECTDPNGCPAPVDEPTPETGCSDDSECQAESYCNAAGDCVVAVCGNGLTEPGESCDDGNLVPTDDCTASCEPAECGDSIVWQGMEACDDGNTDNTDDCSNSCEIASCGNGVVDGDDACDDGNTSNTDGCLNTCEFATCGDGFEQTGVEACDLGMLNRNDGPCLPSCVQAACGDGFTHAGVEQCDDGNNFNNDGCNNDCTFSTCGDGVVDPTEECDDANAINGDGCDNNCTTTRCGNYITDPTEQCDDGNLINEDSCLDDCTNNTCTDGFRWPGEEECDDGNTVNEDDCTNACTNATCGDGATWAGQEECDDANQVNGDGCDNNCTVTACGNEIIAGTEECDDGVNNSNTGACLLNCMAATCGDGLVWAGVEECDDGNQNNEDGCTTACEITTCGNGMIDPEEGCDLSASTSLPPGTSCVACQLECAAGTADCNEDPTDGCEETLGTSMNCGGCGNDCGPGACSAEVCQAFTVTTANTSRVVLDDNYAYFYDAGVWRANRDGTGTNQQLFSSPPPSAGIGAVFGVDQTHIYFLYVGNDPCTTSIECVFGGQCVGFGSLSPPTCRNNDAIARIPKAGAAVPQILLSGGLDITASANLHLDTSAGEVYFAATSAGDTDRPGVIPSNGGAVSYLAPAVPADQLIQHMTVSGGDAYWNRIDGAAILFGGDFVLERNSVGSSPQILYSVTTPPPFPFANAILHRDDGYLYVSMSNLMRIPEQGGQVLEMVAPGNGFAFKALRNVAGRMLAMRDNGLFEIRPDTANVVSAPLFSGQNILTFTGDDDEFLFFVQGNSSLRTIKGIRLPPAE